MLLQHTAIVFADSLPMAAQWPMQFAGGFTFPIMAFMLVEGYRRTSNVGRYALRLLLFAAASQVPFFLAFGAHVGNVMFTLALGLVMLVLHDKMPARPLFWLVFAFFTLASTFFLDWGLYGPVMMILYHVIPNERLRRILPAAAAAALIAATSILGLMALNTPEMAYAEDTARLAAGLHFSFAFAAGIAVPVVLLQKYNGNRGRSMRYMFYAFYPAHLLVLAGLTL